MNDSKVSVGVIGTGWGVNVMIPALMSSPDIEVAAVCSKRLARAEQAAATFGIGAAYDDYRQLVRHEGLDLVCVCTPPATHYEITMAAIEAGRHVFVTKPLGSSVDEARRLRDAATRKGVIHSIDLGGRYVPTYRYMRDLLAEGYIGELRFVSTTCYSHDAVTPGSVIYYSSWVSKRPDGGMLRTKFLHQIDRLRFIFGELDHVRGMTATLVREKPILADEHGSPYGLDAGARVVGTERADADDTVLVHGRFENGAVFNALASWSLHHAPGDRIEAYGSDGSLVLDAHGALHGGRSSEPALQRLVVPQSYALPHVAADANQEELVYASGRTSLYSDYVQDLVNLILGRSSLRLFPTFDDGVRVLEIQDAVDDPAGSV